MQPEILFAPSEIDQLQQDNSQLRAKLAELQALGQALPFPWCLDFIQPQ